MRARWINVGLGAWLFLTALLVGPGVPEFAVHLVLGMGIFLLAFMAMGIPKLRWVTAALGGWVTISPLVFRYMASRLAFHDIVVGIFVIWAAVTPPHPHPSQPPTVA